MGEKTKRKKTRYHMITQSKPVVLNFYSVPAPHSSTPSQPDTLIPILTDYSQLLNF